MVSYAIPIAILLYFVFQSDALRLVSAEARDLVLAMLEADPRKRISAKDALQHPWICSRVAPASKPAELRAKEFASSAACVIS